MSSVFSIYASLSFQYSGFGEALWLATKAQEADCEGTIILKWIIV
jgi:hypothetical protein